MYTPKFIRRSIWSIAIGLDEVTVYTELDGRVYRVIAHNDEPTFVSLPTLYPHLFVEASTKCRDFTRIDIVCDFSQLPKFSGEWQYYGDDVRHVLNNNSMPLSCRD